MFLIVTLAKHISHSSAFNIEVSHNIFFARRLVIDAVVAIFKDTRDGGNNGLYTENGPF